MPLLPKSPAVLLHFNEVPVGGTKDVAPSGTSLQSTSTTVQVINQTLAGLKGQTFALDNTVYSLDISSFDVSKSFTLKYAEYITKQGDGSADIVMSSNMIPSYSGIMMNYSTNDGNYRLYVSSAGNSWNLVSGNILATQDVGKWMQYELDYDATTKKIYYFKDGALIYSSTLAANPYYNADSDHNYVYINYGTGRGTRKGYMKNFDFLAGTCSHTESFTPDVIDQSTKCTIVNSQYITNTIKSLGAGSLILDGTGYIKLPNNVLDTTRDFTVSFREYMNSVVNPSAGFYSGCISPGSSSGGLLFGINNGSGTRLIYASSTIDGSTSWNLLNGVSVCSTELNKWIHWEIDYVDSTKTLYVFKDGSLLKTFALSSRIGCGGNGQAAFGNWGNNINGYLDECMILNGEALHTSDFTIPADEYTCDTYYLVKTNDGKFYSINNSMLTDIGAATDAAAVESLFKSKGSYFAASSTLLASINSGSNKPINVCWQGTPGENLPNSTVVGAPIKAQFVYMNSDFQLTKMSNLDWFKVNNGTINAETGAGKIRHIVSRDSGKTWYAYDKVNAIWKQVIDMSSSSTADGAIDANGKFILNNTAITNALTNGMGAADFALVPWNTWTLVDGYKTIRFACVLCVESASDKAMLDNIQYQYDGMGKWKLAANRTDYEVATDNTSHAIKWLSGLNGKRIKVNY